MIAYGSLFSGVGGFELGLNSLGWECKWMNEIEDLQKEVLKKNFPIPKLYGDIYEINGSELKPVDVIVGGFPCQSFSQAGSKDGSGLELFDQFVRIVKEIERLPKYVIWENVPGILFKSEWMSYIYTAWSKIGAVAQEHRIFDAQYFGVPQRRRRVIGVVGFDTSITSRQSILFNKKGGSRDSEQGKKKKYQAPKSSKEDLKEPLAFHLTQDPISSSISPALSKTSFGMGILNNGKARKLTPIECERLMGWPDDHTRFRSDGSEIPKTKRYQMCGNGIVSPIVSWVGKQIEEQINDL